MSYKIYLNSILFPVSPSLFEYTYKNNNKTILLADDSEINILKKAGLKEMYLELLLPNVSYPFANYIDSFLPADYFLEQLVTLKDEVITFTLTKDTGYQGFSTSVTIEDYTVKEDASQGNDAILSLNLKEYKNYSTAIVSTTSTDTSTTQTSRPVTTTAIYIGCNIILNGQVYRDSYGNGGGNTYTNLYGKVNFINEAGSHPYHITDLNGSWLGWVKSSCVTGV